MDYINNYGDLDSNSYDEISSDDQSVENSLEKLCEICKINVRLYKCPKCSTFSCSLKCCKQHKIERSCNGLRDRIEFIPLKDFSDNNLRNDYHFLEDVLSNKLKGKRTLNNLGVESMNGMKRKKDENIYQNEPKHLSILKNEASTRGISLITMPQGMSKRKINTTRFISNANLILWRVFIVFISNKNFKISDTLRLESDVKPVDKSFIVSDSLIRVSLPEVSEHEKINDIITNLSNQSPENSALRHALSGIRKCKNLKAFIQKLPSVAETPSFIQVDGNSTLKEALKNKTIIEYPTLIVIPSELENYLPIYIQNQEDNQISSD